MSEDPKDTQPFTHGEAANNREYIPASWKARGMGGGAPKISGGYTKSRTNGAITTRGYNRPDQRYLLSDEELDSRRRDRAEAEFDAAVILQGDSNLIEIRSASGNNFDLSNEGTDCDCTDKLRLVQSGKFGADCKHAYMVQHALALYGSYANLPWSAGKLGEVLGVSRRTAEQLCSNGTIPAIKIHGVWVITPDGTVDAAITDYEARLIMPTQRPDLP